MAINSVIRFLQAARNLAKQGMSKEQILDFARREFGKVSELLRKQIDDIYSRYKNLRLRKKVMWCLLRQKKASWQLIKLQKSLRKELMI